MPNRLVKVAVAIDYSKELRNSKYERFCQEYIVDNNATQAVIRAEYSKKGAKQKGSQLLTIVDIASRIRHLQENLSIESGIDAKRIVDELAKIGFSNIQDYIEEAEDGNEIKNLATLDRDLAAAVESIQIDVRHDGGDSKGYTEKTRFKLYDKKGALVELGKHLGIFEKDNRQKLDPVTDLIKEISGIGQGLQIKEIGGNG